MKIIIVYFFYEFQKWLSWISVLHQVEGSFAPIMWSLVTSQRKAFPGCHLLVQISTKKIAKQVMTQDWAPLVTVGSPGVTFELNNEKKQLRWKDHSRQRRQQVKRDGAAGLGGQGGQCLQGGLKGRGGLGARLPALGEPDFISS